ncbi:RNA polymerase-associated protein LEO1 [Trypanosoma brucei equiperdum]|uniref:RNA polymerase-associated protein LEO1 n=1 Tax=Trypanosoma brucei equiperdum TaxID=630700 RepID=A0A3L6L0J7_9TRYP|nr:RNA polymerase-associated protein LEO1 [Trypanosoma brucei equiperdum]
MYRHGLESEEQRHEDLLLLPTQSDTQTTEERTTANPTTQGATDEGGSGAADGEGAATYLTPRAVSVDSDLTLEDLFGPLFYVDESLVVVDPALLGSRSLLRRFFGDTICETDVDITSDNEEALRKEVELARKEACVNYVYELFGEEGAAIIGTQEPKPFDCLVSSVPDKQNVGLYEEMWLTDMPKIAPNRQTLHMEPRPYVSSNPSAPLRSTERSLYTTQNVIRWSIGCRDKLFVSNARIVRWSDGSTTLRVGSDSFPLQLSRDNAITMLASPSAISKGDLTLPAMVSVINPSKHFVAECNSAASIEKAVNEENQRIRSVSAQHNLAYSVPTLPRVDWNNLAASGTPEGEFLARSYNLRKKMMEQRKNRGEPMTLTEQLQMESELFEKLQSLSAKELLEQQQEQERQAALRSLTRQNQTAHRRRFERTVELEGGEYREGHNSMGGGNTGLNGGDFDNNDEDEEIEDDYETMLENVRRKRQREDDEADAKHARNIRLYEQARAGQYGSLIDSMQDLLSQLPDGSIARESVDETVEFLRAGSFSPAVVIKEVPLMLEGVASECPDVDIGKVREELRKLHERK